MAQMEVIPGRPDLNCRRMLAMMDQARAKGARLVIFPALSIPGRLLGDTWEQQAFLRDCEYYGRQIVAASQGITVIFGNVGVDWNRTGDDGRVRRYNAIFIAQNGSLHWGDNSLYPFNILEWGPQYAPFNLTHYFYSPRKLAPGMGLAHDVLTGAVEIEIAGDKLRLA